MSQDSHPHPFHSSNGILVALPTSGLARLWPRIQRVELAPRQVLYGAHTQIPAVYFLESGMVSLIARLERGGAVEVGVIGREGIVGLPLAFGADSSPDEALVLAPGVALRMNADAFREELERSPALLALLLRYQCVLHAHVAQNAACNGRHLMEQRLARWLLIARDRLEARELPLTQEMLATMLGVRRAGVTSTLGAMQRAGIIGFSKGRIVILDSRKLESASCECYAAIQREYDRLPSMGLMEPGAGRVRSVSGIRLAASAGPDRH